MSGPLHLFEFFRTPVVVMSAVFPFLFGVRHGVFRVLFDCDSPQRGLWCGLSLMGCFFGCPVLSTHLLQYSSLFLNFSLYELTVDLLLFQLLVLLLSLDFDQCDFLALRPCDDLRA